MKTAALLMFLLITTDGRVTQRVSMVRRQMASGLRARSSEADGPAWLAELLLVASMAGLPPGSALERIAPSAPAGVADIVWRLNRSAKSVGLEKALLDIRGPFEPLCAVVARATVTGSGLASGLRSYIEAAHADEHAKRLVRVQRLPVRLLFPLALLILPGFVLLVMGPVLIEAFGRLQFSLPPGPGR